MLDLATKLMNYEINIMTDQEDSEKRQLEFKEKTENFVKNLELDETLGSSYLLLKDFLQ